jgi:hypothetical protein
MESSFDQPLLSQAAFGMTGYFLEVTEFGTVRYQQSAW